MNELINISLGQERFTEQKNPPIKFLYTTRDSIFEHKTKGIIKDNNTRYAHQLEIENRTKFFDVIVPLLPFSTSYNAYEYLTQLLNDSNFPIEIKIDRELQDIVSSSISDYRLIANIISEFQIFTKQIFDVHGEGRKMTEFFKKHTNHLFAFIAYKNTHLTDYEKMQNGNSNIDKVCTEFSELMISINRISIEEAYSAAGEIGFSWWLVEHYFSYHVDCPDGCDSGEPARGRKDPPYFQMSYGSFDHIPDLVDPFVESLLPA